jgi:hypothetical protein
MGYNKIISYGNTLEVYEYEKDIVRLVGRARKKGDRKKGDRDNKIVKSVL